MRLDGFRLDYVRLEEAAVDCMPRETESQRERRVVIDLFLECV